MKNVFIVLLVCLVVGSGKSQSESPSMEGMLQQMEQRMQLMLEQFGQQGDGFMQIDTFFFLNPDEQNVPFGVLPPVTGGSGIEQLLESLQESMLGINRDSLLDLGEIFRSFGQIEMQPMIPAPKMEPHPQQPEGTSKPKKKRKIYQL